jgi:hypothetical protein
VGQPRHDLYRFTTLDISLQNRALYWRKNSKANLKANGGQIQLQEFFSFFFDFDFLK